MIGHFLLIHSNLYIKVNKGFVLDVSVHEEFVESTYS